MLISAMSVPYGAAYAEEPGDEDSQIEQLSGNTYFDFAFRDKQNILQEGHLGDSRDILAQATPVEPENTQAEETPGFGLSNEEINQKIENIHDDKSYRIADLTIQCDIDFCNDNDHVDALLRANIHFQCVLDVGD